MAINTQKFLPQGKKGGKLTVLPKATLAPVKPSSSDITKVEGVEESPIMVIKKSGGREEYSRKKIEKRSCKINRKKTQNR